jgi:hypothetical protein
VALSESNDCQDLRPCVLLANTSAFCPSSILGLRSAANPRSITPAADKDEFIQLLGEPRAGGSSGRRQSSRCRCRCSQAQGEAQAGHLVRLYRLILRHAYVQRSDDQDELGTGVVWQIVPPATGFVALRVSILRYSPPVEAVLYKSCSHKLVSPKVVFQRSITSRLSKKHQGSCRLKPPACLRTPWVTQHTSRTRCIAFYPTDG